jgi:ABC-type multidrug transport system fused ATPase/permease subunit
MSGEKEGGKKLTREKIAAGLYVFKYIKPYKWYFVWGMLALVAGSLIFMVFPGAAGEMANVAIGKDTYHLGLSIEDYGWLFLIILILQGVLSYIRTVFFAIVSEKGMADLRKDLFDNIITQSIAFYEERRVGELTSRITTDVEQLQSVFSITLAELLRQVVVLISGIAIIAYLTPGLSLLMLLTFPVIVVIAMVFGKYIRKLSKNRQDHLAETNTIVEECLQSFYVVKSYANEWYESLRYRKSIDSVVGISLSFAKIRGLFFIFIITVLFGGMFFILWRGAIMVQNGEMEAGDLFSFIIYTAILGGAIASFGNLYTSVLQALGATERIREILMSNTEVKIADGEKARTSAPIEGKIQYSQVGFAYPSRQDLPVLKGIDLDVEKGQKIALVGQSGSGKSTIVQLLMRFYQPGSGSITIDGLPIEQYNISDLRHSIWWQYSGKHTLWQAYRNGTRTFFGSRTGKCT